MARIEPRTVTLKDGAQVLLRPGEPDDTPALFDHFDDLDRTSNYGVGEPGERVRTAEAQAKTIKEINDSDNGVFVVAMVGDLLVGEISFKGNKHSRMAHHGHLGIGIRSGWRGRGLGEILMRVLIEWAVAHPRIEKVCLGVFAENVPAIALYKKLGFVEECRRDREFKYGPGRYMDDIQMSLWVKPPGADRTMGAGSPMPSFTRPPS